jgi:hypothetical protein
MSRYWIKRVHIMISIRSFVFATFCRKTLLFFSLKCVYLTKFHDSLKPGLILSLVWIVGDQFYVNFEPIHFVKNRVLLWAIVNIWRFSTNDVIIVRQKFCINVQRIENYLPNYVASVWKCELFKLRRNPYVKYQWWITNRSIMNYNLFLSLRSHCLPFFIIHYFFWIIE